MVSEASDVMNAASMTLSKWCSNDDHVGDLLSRDFQDRSLLDQSVKVLGTRWIAK